MDNGYKQREWKFSKLFQNFSLKLKLSKHNNTEASKLKYLLHCINSQYFS